MQHHSRYSRTINWSLGALAIVPIAIMAHYVLTHGGENFSDDYGVYLEFLSDVSNHRFSLHLLIKHSLHGPHFLLVPVALRALWFQAGIWSVPVEIWGSLIIGVLRVCAIYFLVGHHLATSRMRVSALALASFAVFAPAQLSQYVYGDTGLTMGLDNLGFILGLLFIDRARDSWKFLTLIILSGLLSTLSWGVGITWVMFFAAMAISGWRSKWMYVAVFVAAVASLCPLAYYLVSTHSHGSGIVSLFSPSFVLGALGRPMSPAGDNIDPHYLYGLIVGGVGVVMMWALLGYIRLGKKLGNFRTIKLFQICSWLFIYSIACIYQVSIFRSGIGSWYTPLSINLWLAIGIASLAILDISPRARANTFVAVASITVLVGLFVASNFSFAHKTVFLHSRALSSESCVRNYKNAPTFCELSVFNWQPTYEFASFSNFFDRTQTSVFGRNQTWTLQGDYILPTVEPIEPGLSRVEWKRGHRLASWNSPDRLDLDLAQGTGIKWTVTFSPRVEKATLRFKSQGITTVTAIKDGSAVQLFAGDKADISLDTFIGKTVTLIVSGADKHTILSYPRIDVVQKRDPKESLPKYRTHIGWVPTNTDKSPYFPKPTPLDIVLHG